MKTARIEKCVNEAWKKVIKDYKDFYVWWEESDWVASMYFHLRNSLKNRKEFRVVTEYSPRAGNANVCNDCTNHKNCVRKYLKKSEKSKLDLAVLDFSEELNNLSGIPEEGGWFRKLWCIKHIPIIAIQFKCDSESKLRERTMYKKHETWVLMKDILILNDMISSWKADYGFMFVVTDMDSKHDFDDYFPNKSLKKISAGNRKKIKLGILNFNDKDPNESEIYSLYDFEKNWNKIIKE